MHISTLLSKRREAGSSLILVVFVVVLLGVLIGLAYDYTASTTVATRRGQDLTSAQALANGALETAYKRWSVYMSARQAAPFSNYTNDSDFDTFTPSLMTQMNAAAAATGFQLTELTIRSVSRSDVPCGVQTDSNAALGPLDNTPGWIASKYGYRARILVSKTSDPSIKVWVSRYFQHSDASLFQAMLFFQDDLELHPGPAMTLYGLVHTNSNMYLAAGNGGSLTFTSNVSYHGNGSTLKYNTANVDYVRTPTGYVEGTTARLYDQESGNWTKGNYKDPVYYDSVAQANISRDARLSNVDALNPLGIDVKKAVDDNPGNPNASDLHEIIERPAPTSKYDPNPNAAYTDPDAFAAHRLYNTAGLRIFIDHSTSYTTGTGSSTVKSNVHVYAPVSPGSASSTELLPSVKTGKNPQADNIVDYINKAISVGSATNGTFKDMREGRDITTNTVDMSVLTPALNAYANANHDYSGVVYITDVTNANATTGDTGNSDAIRLKKGGTLPDMGLTMVTDGAMYVQGDYNTGTTYAADLPANNVVELLQPISNTGTNATTDPTHYTVGTYVQKPAAVVGDAVMILSNAWSDLNDSLPLNNALRPKATATTFNAAIVSGAVITTDANASGGAHNFPRFLEDWQSKTPFTYHGSMCELYQSDHFKGAYGQADVYSPPNRRWFFDDNFLTTPPPGNLRTTSYSRGRWMRHNALN